MENEPGYVKVKSSNIIPMKTEQLYEEGKQGIKKLHQGSSCRLRLNRKTALHKHHARLYVWEDLCFHFLFIYFLHLNHVSSF